MKRKLSCLLLGATLLLAPAPMALVRAQTSLHDWSVVKAVGVDERLIVKQKDGSTIEGKMIEATDTNLTLSRKNKVVHISRDNIQQIEHSKGKAQKGKWALIGAGIGAGVGGGIGLAKNNSIIDDGELYIAAGVLIGAGSGAVGGALFGASKRYRELIYTAP
jgi:hypothetical protein